MIYVRANPDLRFERNAKGGNLSSCHQLEGETGNIMLEFTADFCNLESTNRIRAVFDSSSELSPLS
jgi:hypothetical protein